jgi:transcription initiation factor TFIIIB Brf1 subunit/transcription initiation factor TFIIB
VTTDLSGYSRAEAISRKLGIQLKDAERIAYDPNNLTEEQRIQKARAHAELGVLTAPEVEEALLEGYKNLQQDYHIPQDRIDKTFELLEGVSQEGRKISSIASSAIYAQQQIERNTTYHSPHYPNQEEIARACNVNSRTIRQYYGNLLKQSETREVQQLADDITP